MSVFWEYNFFFEKTNQTKPECSSLSFIIINDTSLWSLQLLYMYVSIKYLKKIWIVLVMEEYKITIYNSPRLIHRIFFFFFTFFYEIISN